MVCVGHMSKKTVRSTVLGFPCTAFLALVLACSPVNQAQAGLPVGLPKYFANSYKLYYVLRIEKV
jgi:hypothetical protein